jgi:uncharacterized protein (UPF0332 family)
MNPFVKTLIKEEKITLVQPNNTISQAYIDKSLKSLISSKTLFKIEHYDDAFALSYYSIYYSLLALLFKCGIKSENHTGSIILLKELFNIDNELYKNKKATS